MYVLYYKQNQKNFVKKDNYIDHLTLTTTQLQRKKCKKKPLRYPSFLNLHLWDTFMQIPMRERLEQIQEGKLS